MVVCFKKMEYIELFGFIEEMLVLSAELLDRIMYAYNTVPADREGEDGRKKRKWKTENYHKLSKTYDVSHSAPHVGRNETIDLFQKRVKFSRYEDAR